MTLFMMLIINMTEDNGVAAGRRSTVLAVF